MSKNKAADYQEIVENLQARIIAFQKMRSMENAPIERYIIDFEIKHIEKRISFLRKEIFFQIHPNLQKYRIHIEELPLLIACFLDLSTILIFIIVLSANPNLEIIYRILCVVCAPIFLFLGVRQYLKFANRLNEQAKLKIEFTYPKLFLEIENYVSLLNSEGNNG